MVAVVPYTEKYLEASVQLFIDVYSDTKGTWSIQKAQEYIGRASTISPRYCFVAIDGVEYLGSIFAYLSPNYDSDLLFIDTLQVTLAHRKKGVAKRLLQTVIEIAKTEHINEVCLWTDVSKHFPKSWYQALGFKDTGWSELSLRLN